MRCLARRVRRWPRGTFVKVGGKPISSRPRVSAGRLVDLTRSFPFMNNSERQPRPSESQLTRRRARDCARSFRCSCGRGALAETRLLPPPPLRTLQIVLERVFYLRCKSTDRFLAGDYGVRNSPPEKTVASGNSRKAFLSACVASIAGWIALPRMLCGTPAAGPLGELRAPKIEPDPRAVSRRRING